MRGSDGFAAARTPLIKGAALGKLWIELPAEFARPAGACVEAIDDGGVNVFHEKRLLGGRERIHPGCEAESQYLDLASDDCINCMVDAFVLHGTGPVQAPRCRCDFPTFLCLRVG